MNLLGTHQVGREAHNAGVTRNFDSLSDRQYDIGNASNAHRVTLANSSDRVASSAMRPVNERAGPYSHDYSLGMIHSAGVSKTASPATRFRGAPLPFGTSGRAWAPAEGAGSFDDRIYSVEAAERALRNFEIYHNM